MVESGCTEVRGSSKLVQKKFTGVAVVQSGSRWCRNGMVRGGHGGWKVKFVWQEVVRNEFTTSSHPVYTKSTSCSKEWQGFKLKDKF